MRIALCCLVAIVPALRAADDYKLGPDSDRQPGVPEGQGHPAQVDEQGLPRHRARLLGLRPGAVRRQDARVRHGLSGRRQLRQNAKGQFRVPIVFDNLIHKKEMPVTIGIFINPGDVPAAPARDRRRSNRSFEYDTLSPQYATLPREGDPAGGGQGVQAAAGRGRPGDRRHQLRRHLCVHRGLGAAGPVQQGAQPRRQLHQHPRRRRLSGHDPQDASGSRSASSCRTARTTWTTCTATGRWPTCRWRRR